MMGTTTAAMLRLDFLLSASAGEDRSEADGDDPGVEPVALGEPSELEEGEDPRGWPPTVLDACDWEGDGD